MFHEIDINKMPHPFASLQARVCMVKRVFPPNINRDSPTPPSEKANNPNLNTVDNYKRSFAICFPCAVAKGIDFKIKSSLNAYE